MVANRAGVSVATVSKYLNGGNVIEANKIKVQKAVEELNYSMNEVARSLKMNRTFTVGIMAACIQSTFITGIISSVQNTLLQQGYSAIVVDYREDKELEKKQLEVLLKRQVDGIILFPEENEMEIITSIRRHGIPVVMIDNIIEGIECDAVITDGLSSSRLVTEELIKKGHRRIGVIKGPDYMYTARERFAGYCLALREHGLPFSQELIANGNYDVVGGYEATKSILSRANRPSALLVTNYYMTIGALKAIKEQSLQIPEDISFVSFDALEFNCVLSPEISTVAQPISDIGQLAADCIVARMKNDFSDFPKVEKLKTTVVFTDSIKALDK